MALPNYSPSGRIIFGSVPWDSSYVNVRLYSSLTEQYNDIASMMNTSAGANDYVYIGRNRRLKVQIEADRLYHCNYCMYRNDSITDGWIYCFVSDVQYVNDHTSEVTLETDVFQTYLYQTDWTIPACFIERETTPSEDDRYMLTSEPDFPLIYTVDQVTHQWFDASAFVIMTCGNPKENQNIIEDVLNPMGYYASPAPVSCYKGLIEGCNMFVASGISPTGIITEDIEAFLNKMNQAGSIESIVAVFTIPSFAADEIFPLLENQFVSTNTRPDGPTFSNVQFDAPPRGTSLNGYTPRNKKLLYYPYNFCKLTDFNGSTSELRYELMGNDGQIDIKYVVSPTCQAFAYPDSYMGITGYDVGIVTACGAQGSWANNTFTTWLAQNSGTIALTIAGLAVAGAAGAATVGAASAALVPVEAASPVMTSAGLGAGLAAAASNPLVSKTVMGAAAGAGMMANSAWNASKQPTVTRGQTGVDVTFATGMQGVHAERVCCKAEIAEQIDEFFDRWGYEVDRIEGVDITSRPSWNYVKTQGSAPRSVNVAAGSAAPFSRGRGTPAEALDVIRRAFDNGVTFWHTTTNFGNFSLANGVS